MESAILGRYAEYVRQLHPETPVPGVFLAEKLFADAEGSRASLGDEAFRRDRGARHIGLGTSASDRPRSLGAGGPADSGW
ncbi:MAG: hypothetical protein GY719_20160 [bacterium]|nr:hypothetical protein [bacterium]